MTVTPMPDTTLTSAELVERKLPAIDPEFIVICASAWMNERGFGFGYDWDGARFGSRAQAIKHGRKQRGSDDFNIGMTYGDDLIWFGWRDERLMENEETMREIAEAIGLDFNPDWYWIDYAKATGKPLRFMEKPNA